MVSEEIEVKQEEETLPVAEEIDAGAAVADAVDAVTSDDEVAEDGAVVEAPSEEVPADPQEEARALRHLDVSFYRLFYKDLNSAGISDDASLIHHYLKFGRHEDRFGSVVDWLTSRELPEDLFGDGLDWNELLERAQQFEPNISLASLLEKLIAPSGPSFDVFGSASQNADLYTSIAKFYFLKQMQGEAETFLAKAIRFDSKNGRALEYLGNIETDRGRPLDAIRFYRLALDAGNDKDWLFLNLSKALLAVGQVDEAYQQILRCMDLYPQFSLVEDHLDALSETLWAKVDEDSKADILFNDRETLIDKVGVYTDKVYQTYLKYFGVTRPPEFLGDINPDRVLILGDFVVPQCTRYRIDQKVAQLEAAGVTVETRNWMEIGHHIEELAFYDVVIFYRVPALPKVLKAMAQVSATGKLAIYEIDDMLFEADYPPPIHTYGSLVDEHQYAGLMKGMALYHAAARCCRIGLASTQPLADLLGPLTQSGKCLLHRNGLDELNVFRSVDRSFKDTVDIFYGSGTKAHNSDLVEIIMPVMRQVLEAHENARFIVMGYAQLPSEFMQQFGDQIVQLPLTSNVTSYYEQMQWADVCLAVLHSDKINDCKSELKWFEPACFGIPSVVSATANFRDVINDGVDGFLASNTQEWVDALGRLIEEPELRKSVGQTAFERIQKEYMPETLGASLHASLTDVSKALQAPEKATRSVPKVAVVNVFMRPQSIGGATRVVEDNLDSFERNHADELDVVLFSSDVHARVPHRVTVHMDGKRRNYRATIVHREHMDWHPRDPDMQRLFEEFLELEKPDLVHFHCVQRMTASVVEAAREMGVPYIITVHDAWWISDYQFMVTPTGEVYTEGHPDPFANDVTMPGVDQVASMERRNHLKTLMLSAAATTTVSKGYAEIYQHNGLTDILPIRNGISDMRLWAEKDTSDKRRVVIGHIGGVSAHKGYDLLRDVVSIMALQNVEILVADHSMEEGSMRRERWGSVPVTYVGRFSQSRVADLYRQIDVLAAPSIWPESFGLVTREAAACGCWVIASNLGGIGEDVIDGETGFVIPPNRDALIQVLLEIDKYPARYKEAVPPHKIRYSAEQAEKLVKLYQDVLSSAEVEADEPVADCAD
jgi:glycosyltransferase involved in cell wall biosynthesis